MFTMQMMSTTIRPIARIRAMMAGPRWLIQSVASGATTFLMLAFTRVTLLNPQLTQTTASGGSSSLAQCGQRATSDSWTTPIGLGACPRPGAPPSPQNGFLGFSGAGGVAAAALPADTWNTCWHSLHLIFLPSSWVGTFRALPHLGHEMSRVAGMVDPQPRRNPGGYGHKADAAGSRL